MERPKKKHFDNGDHITDWLYWEQKYTKALNNYIDWLEKQLTLTDVSQHRELLEWLSNEDYFNIPKDEISEILEDWHTYNSNCG